MCLKIDPKNSFLYLILILPEKFQLDIIIKELKYKILEYASNYSKIRLLG